MMEKYGYNEDIIKLAKEKGISLEEAKELFLRLQEGEVIGREEREHITKAAKED